MLKLVAVFGHVGRFFLVRGGGTGRNGGTWVGTGFLNARSAARQSFPIFVVGSFLFSIFS